MRDTRTLTHTELLQTNKQCQLAPSRSTSRIGKDATSVLRGSRFRQSVCLCIHVLCGYSSVAAPSAFALPLSTLLCCCSASAPHLLPHLCCCSALVYSVVSPSASASDLLTRALPSCILCCSALLCAALLLHLICCRMLLYIHMRCSF